MKQRSSPTPGASYRQQALKSSIRDYRAVVWTAGSGQPQPMGDLLLSPQEARFSYREGFAESGAAGLSRLYSPEVFGHHPIVWQRRDYFDLPPPLQAQLNAQGPHNLQYRLALAWLREQGITPEPGFASDWAVLMVNGHGGIGHLDVFSSDESARKWYRDAKPPRLFQADAEFGHAVKNTLAWQDGDATDILPLIGPAPSVAGMIPKFLLSMPEKTWTEGRNEAWDGRIAMPCPQGVSVSDSGVALSQVVLKIEHTEAYRGLMELEALALDMHAEAGFEVPPHQLAEIAGMPVLAVERFDRSRAGQPLPLESLHSIMAIGAKDVSSHHSVSYDRIAKALNHPEVSLVSDRRAARRHLLRRLIYALLTGNGDLHMQNLSILERDGEVSFSPIYDPAPMRAFARHDLLAVMPFGGYGDGFDLADALLNFAHASGVHKDGLREIMSQALDVSADFRARLPALSRLPKANRQHLQKVLDGVAKQLKVLA